MKKSRPTSQPTKSAKPSQPAKSSRRSKVQPAAQPSRAHRLAQSSFKIQYKALFGLGIFLWLVGWWYCYIVWWYVLPLQDQFGVFVSPSLAPASLLLAVLGPGLMLYAKRGR